MPRTKATVMSIIMFLLNTQEALTLTIEDFYPFGPEHNDTQLTRGDDVVNGLPLPIEFPFSGKRYTFLGVSIEAEYH